MLANILTDFTDWLDEISAHWWFLLVILAVAFFDSIIPIVPSETTVILGGVAAGQGNQNILLVIAAGAVGAFLGDNTAYMIGRRFSGWIQRRAERSEKTARRLAWAGDQIRKRGGPLLITARFIPGGRTRVDDLVRAHPSAPGAGSPDGSAMAAVIWATYAAGLGYFFGQRFKDNHTLAFLLAFGTALAVTGIIELIRHRRAAAAEQGPAPLP